MPNLHPQLLAIQRELADATARARRLIERVDEVAFEKRPVEGSWSAAECVAHLNLTSKAFLPLIDDGFTKAPTGPANPHRRYRRDAVGWLLTKMMEPPARIKVKTPPPFVPKTWGSRHDLLAEFESLQRELSTRLEEANEFDIGHVRVRSPFSTTMRYGLLGGFTAITAHQRRHLWQAERAAGLAAPGA